jgi:hypothetical protein
MYPPPDIDLDRPENTRVNFERFVVVAEVAAEEEVLVDEEEVVREEAFVFLQSDFGTAFAGPHWTGLHPGNWSKVPVIGSGNGFAIIRWLGGGYTKTAWILDIAW